MYQILPHTADVRLLVTAREPEELFISAVAGLAEIQRPGFCENPSSKWDLEETVEVHSGDMTTLLIDFLSDILTRSHINRGIYCHVRFAQCSETLVLATIRGRTTDGTDEDIKAVTYHEAHIRVNADGLLETMIIFDI